MVKEFSSLAEKEQYEADRINYYLKGISPSSTFEFYKNLFVENFTKEGRRLKKLYDGYEGGYYRDEYGFIHVDHIEFLPSKNFNHGEIAIEDATKRVYIKDDKEDVFCYIFDDILKNSNITVSNENSSDVTFISGESLMIKEAKWEINCDGYYPYCTNCNEEPPSGVMTNYCPNCGAKMFKNTSNNN